MRKLLTFSFSLLSLSSINAQTPSFNTSEDIDINNIRASHLVHGDMWWDPITQTDKCEYPKGSGKHLAGATSLWIGGFDPQGYLHLSAQTYRQNGNDYWPGPIDTTSNTNMLYMHETAWAKIWKVNKSTIDSFRAISLHTVSNTSNSILRWPGLGNAYAQGNNGAPLNITSPMAPFVDVDGDGVYDPLNGDYPLIKGDQMLWWVVNDAGVMHNESQALPLKIEICNSAYAYKRGGMIDNMIFYEYVITNKSTQHYDSLRIGQFSDVDLGYPNDDFIGFDSTRRMGVVYNGKIADGSGQSDAYGANIPIAGLCMTELPGDGGNNHTPCGSFVYFSNDFSAYGNPVGGSQLYNYLNSRSVNGVPFINGEKYATGLSTMCDSFPHAITFDRRIVIASNTLSLAAGATVKVGMALVVCPNAGGCPNVSFSCLLNIADSALIIYHSPPATLGVTAVSTTPSLRVYPNPAQNVLFVEPYNGHTDGSIKIYDAIGRDLLLETKTHSGKFVVNTSPLARGIYTLIYRNIDGLTITTTFVKSNL